MSQIEIAASNLNIEPMAALTYDADDYEKFLVDGEFDLTAGFEWSDVRFPAAQRAGRLLAERGLIQTLHESWNERTGISALSDGLEGVKIAVAFRRLDACYGALTKVQAATSGRLPIIMHPQGQYLGGSKPRRPRQTMPHGMFAELWYQPTAEWAAHYGIATDSADTAAVAEQIIFQQQVSGLDRMAIDLHHIQSERNGHKFRDPTGLAVALASSGFMAELQVALRPDFGGRIQELEAATRGQLQATQTGEILTAIAESLPVNTKMRIVSEVPASEITNNEDGALSAAHTAINNGIRETFKR